MSSPTLRSVVLPPSAVRRSSARLREALLVLGFSLFVAVSAHIAVRLPFTPVPVTGQTLAVLLTGALLGWRLGSLALLAYLAEGLAGLPVFAGGTSAWSPSPIPGVPVILGPTLGYLVGFVAAAGLVGWLAERGWQRSVARAALAMLLGQATIYAFGLAWLARFVPFEGLVGSGALPFLAGDALKLGLAAVVLPSAWSLLGRARS